jgi:hypothetical protein
MDIGTDKLAIFFFNVPSFSLRHNMIEMMGNMIGDNIKRTNNSIMK